MFLPVGCLVDDVIIKTCSPVDSVGKKD